MNKVLHAGLRPKYTNPLVLSIYANWTEISKKKAHQKKTNTHWAPEEYQKRNFFIAVRKYSIEHFLNFRVLFLRLCSCSMSYSSHFVMLDSLRMQKGHTDVRHMRYL